MLKMELNEREQAGRRSEEEHSKDNESPPADSDNSPTKWAEHSTQRSSCQKSRSQSLVPARSEHWTPRSSPRYMPLPRILWGFLKFLFLKNVANVRAQIQKQINFRYDKIIDSIR